MHTRRLEGKKKKKPLIPSYSLPNLWSIIILPYSHHCHWNMNVKVNMKMKLGRSREVELLKVDGNPSTKSLVARDKIGWRS